MTTILVVDDDGAQRLLVSTTLARKGYTVVLAVNGREGLRMAREQTPDLVISDVNMPLMDGFEMAEAITQLPAGEAIPILFMSTRDDREHFITAMRAGGRDYLVKPFKSAELYDAVERALSRHVSLQATQSMNTPWALDLPGYQWQKMLGEGSSAKVYLGIDEKSGQPQAVKLVTLPAEPALAQEMIARFLNEISLLATISNSHVAKIYGHGVTDHYLYYAMEYFPGGDLRAHIGEGIALADAVRYAEEALMAVEAIHDKQIVHRDLKPDNLMLREDGTLVLADFGIARPANVDMKLTQNNMTQGTPYYVSPEQLRGRPATPQSDLYSMGVVIYEMLTGQPPFGGQRMDLVLGQHLSAPIPKLRGPLAPFQPLIDKLLAKQPADRYATATEALQALRGIAAEIA